MQLIYCLDGPLHGETRTTPKRNNDFIHFPTPKDPKYCVAVYKIIKMKTTLNETIAKFTYCRKRET